jgi:hypothetical protein
MGFEPGLVSVAAPATCPVRLVSVVVVCPCVSRDFNDGEEGEVRTLGRAIGLDVHLDVCEVAIAEDGVVRSAGRIQTKPEQLRLFAQSLGSDDRVALPCGIASWDVGEGRRHRRIRLRGERARRGRHSAGAFPVDVVTRPREHDLLASLEGR